MALLPRVTVSDDGEAEIVKLFTNSMTVVVRVKPPPVPVIVSVLFPAGVLELVVTCSVLLPDPPLIGFGLNVALAPDGNPLTLRVTLLLKPPDGVSVTV